MSLSAPSENTFVPFAIRSGLMRPSSVGPKLENAAIAPAPFIAPTVMMFLATARGPMQSASTPSPFWVQSRGATATGPASLRSLPADFATTRSVAATTLSKPALKLV
jgi:hypothetical protein